MNPHPFHGDRHHRHWRRPRQKRQCKPRRCVPHGQYLNTHTKEEGDEFFRIVPDEKRRLAVLANPAPVKKSTSRSCEHFTGGISNHTLYYILPPMKSRVKSRHDP